MIIKDIKVYDGPLIHKRFAYDYFRNKTLPIGNIIAFRCPMDVSIDGMIDQEDVLQGDYIYSDDAINFCWEIPKKPIEVDGDDLMVHAEFEGSDGTLQKVGKCSVSITYSKDSVAIGHTGINVNAVRKAPNFAYSTGLTDDQTTEFMQDIIDLFYAMVDDMFIATTKINL